MSVFDLSLIDLANSLAGAPVAVIGDLVCDQFIFGRTKRISREAPVLILEHESDQMTLGGAANAINNLADLGAKPYPIGVVGDDLPGRELLSILGDKGIDVSGVIKDVSRPTTLKRRIHGSGLNTAYQQMLRIDQGSTKPVEGQTESALLAKLDEAAKRFSVLVVSDYGYGVISPAVLDRINTLAGRGDLKVLVDSRYRIPGYRKPYLMTPNEPEAEEASGVFIRDEKDVAKAAEVLFEKTDAQAVLITRGRLGMYLAQKNQPPRTLPIFGSDIIADVTGAGDTVMAVMAAALVKGADLYDAARLATVAGGLVVMKPGTATMPVAEIVDALKRYNDGR